MEMFVFNIYAYEKEIINGIDLTWHDVKTCDKLSPYALNL